MDIPFIVQLAKIVGVVLALIIICSIVSLFFKRYRKIGVWILSIIFAGSITTIGYFYCPRHFEKNYLSSQSEINPLFFRQYADSLDFYIGSIGTCEEISDPRFYDNFNSITPENALKIGSLLVNDQIGKYDFSHADSIINLALEKKLRIRGHTLVWGKASWLYKSPDLNSYLDNFPENERGKILWDITKTHITTVLNHYRGKIHMWDAVNEPLATWGTGEFEDNVYTRYLGEEYVEKVFQLTHSIDSGLKLYINEFFWNYKSKRAEAFYQLVKKLKENNIPIHGVGIQCHIPFLDSSFDDFKNFIQRITALGLEVEITELDARLVLFKNADDPYQAQGEYYAEILKICLNNPLCKGVTFWGFSDKKVWYDYDIMYPKPYEPYLFDENMNPKPAFQEIYKTLKKTYDSN